MIPICFITSIFTLLFANASVFLTRNYLKESQGCRSFVCHFDFVELSRQGGIGSFAPTQGRDLRFAST